MSSPSSSNVIKKTVSFLDALTGKTTAAATIHQNEKSSPTVEQQTCENGKKSNMTSHSKKNTLGDDSHHHHRHHVTSIDATTTIMTSSISSPSNKNTNQNVAETFHHHRVGMLHLFPEKITMKSEEEQNTSTIYYKYTHAVVGVDLCGNTHFPSTTVISSSSLSLQREEATKSSFEQSRNCLISISSPVDETQEQQQQSPELVVMMNRSKLFVSPLMIGKTEQASVSIPSPFTFLQQLNHQFSTTHVPLSMAKSMCTFVYFKLIPIFDFSSSENNQKLSTEFVQTCRRFESSSSSSNEEKENEEFLTRQLQKQVSSSLQPQNCVSYYFHLATNKYRRLAKNEQCALCGKSSAPTTSFICSDQHQKLSLGEVKGVMYGRLQGGEIFISIRNLDARWNVDDRKNKNNENNDNDDDDDLNTTTNDNNQNSSPSPSSSSSSLFIATATSFMCVGGFDFWKKFAPTPQQPYPEFRPPRLVYFIPHQRKTNEREEKEEEERFAIIRSLEVPQGVYNRFFSQEAKKNNKLK